MFSSDNLNYVQESLFSIKYTNRNLRVNRNYKNPIGHACRFENRAESVADDGRAKNECYEIDNSISKDERDARNKNSKLCVYVSRSIKL